MNLNQKSNYNISNIKHNLKELFTTFSKDYDTPYEELLEKYIKKNPLFSTLFTDIDKNDIICKAIKQDGYRCTRKSKVGTCFCGKHIKKQKYGSLSNDNEINMFEVKIEDKTYMKDAKNNIYETLDIEGNTRLIGRLDINNQLILAENIEKK
jgi:hypothetical protein